MTVYIMKTGKNKEKRNFSQQLKVKFLIVIPIILNYMNVFSIKMDCIVTQQAYLDFVTVQPPLEGTQTGCII